MVFSFNHLFIVLPSSWILELVLCTVKKKNLTRLFSPPHEAAYFKDRLAVEEVRGLLCNKDCFFLSSVAYHGLLEMRHGTGSIRNGCL
jgi:hypothetical protein